MAIQIPNPGTGNGATGDNEFVLWTKVKDNFSNTTHAASKIVGTASGQIPLAQDVFKSAFSTAADISFYAGGSVGKSCDDLLVGSFVAVSGAMINLPPAITGGAHKDTWVIETRVGYNATRHKIQTAYSYASTTYKVYSRRFYNNAWSAWVQMAESEDTYQTTTASGANVVVDTTGKLMRSTSSERYKDILAPLELDDARYADAMSLKPIVYRSTADADNPAYHYYSFSAEELGVYDPAFTLWRETEMVTDADGSVTEQPLADRQAEGININALLAMGHAIAIKQGELIKGLQEQINALKPKPEV